MALGHGGPRRKAAVVCAAALLFAVLVANRPSDVAKRLRFLRHYAPRPLPVRRLGGSSSAFDRRFFFFLESARLKLPPGTAGVAVFATPSEQGRNVVAYQFAPLPALTAPRAVPRGWVAAIYGSRRPAGWRHIADVSDGALMAPPP